MITISEIAAEAEIRRCLPVMRLLRPHLKPDDDVVVGRIVRQMADGYRLLALLDGAEVRALAGFRFQENLVFGRSIYIDDLVVAPEARRQGHAETMLAKVREIALRAGLQVVALDTALANVGAQKVYERCGYETVAYHLIQRLPD
ncbi:GNAT family N-acetyltransferase [Novosphingobium kaempferiae]|uniref:GNAT family N-acetyltransferase n=1 Tax=Novosphingobium kaempferiae TaxID=2896849 RepID=UPI001E2B6399|nr:GNAT family N-acetyltransferase [Novosphingobium kaempferiae]